MSKINIKLIVERDDELEQLTKGQLLNLAYNNKEIIKKLEHWLEVSRAETDSLRDRLENEDENE